MARDATKHFWVRLVMEQRTRPVLAVWWAAAVFVFSLGAHAESTMTPTDQNGRDIDNNPPPSGLTLEQRVERRSTAHCRSGYRLEALPEGLVCVQRDRQQR